MHPADAVKVADGSHVFWQIIRLRPLEVVDDWDDFAIGVKSGHYLSVHPVLALVVANAAIERVGCEDQKEKLGLTDTLQQVVVKFARLQTLHIDKDGKIPQLQVDCYEKKYILQRLG